MMSQSPTHTSEQKTHARKWVISDLNGIRQERMDGQQLEPEHQLETPHVFPQPWSTSSKSALHV
jgi:hypothetical protein